MKKFTLRDFILGKDLPNTKEFKELRKLENV